VMLSTSCGGFSKVLVMILKLRVLRKKENSKQTLRLYVQRFTYSLAMAAPRR
jgi:hypothetical protein